MTDEKKPSTTQWLFDSMLKRIQTGDWKVGDTIPSERTLMTEFGVSRIALREALSMLRSLGILEVSHGRSSTIRKIDADVIGSLFPLMLTLEGEQCFKQVFEVRLSLEPLSAYAAALRRTDMDIRILEDLDNKYRELAENARIERVEADLAFHIQIAKASQNPLFPVILTALSGFITYASATMSQDDSLVQTRSNFAHAAILDAIECQDAERAQAEMEVHLRFNAHRMLANNLHSGQPKS